MTWLRQNWFLVGLFSAVFLAWLVPEVGRKGGYLRTEWTTILGVAVIFYLQGLMLPTEVLRRGFLKWKLHLLVHALVFLFVPLTVLFFAIITDGFFQAPTEVRAGFLFLAILPTTISSSVVFTSLAHGNTSGALFNAAVTNILGVILVPLWVGWLLFERGDPGEAVPIGPMILKVAMLLLLPLLAGQLFRPFIIDRVERNKRSLGNVCSLIILFIIFSSFSDSFAAGIWSEGGVRLAAGVFTGALALFLAVTAAAVAAGRGARLESPDRTALLFCGSHKTLAAGAPMANLLFAGNPGLGIILLPLIFYILIQLFFGGVLVNFLRRRPPAGT